MSTTISASIISALAHNYSSKKLRWLQYLSPCLLLVRHCVSTGASERQLIVAEQPSQSYSGSSIVTRIDLSPIAAIASGCLSIASLPI